MSTWHHNVQAVLLTLTCIARVDPVKKAVQQLAKKDLLSFAAAVRSRICLGKPNKEQDAQKGVQQGAKKDGFAQTVDMHIQKFEPYFHLTGVILLS